MFKKYLETAGLVFCRPILFYTTMPAVNWKDEPLVFCSITSWVIALFVSAVVFINQLLPIGMTLPVEVHGLKILIVAPVLAVLACMFFIIVCSIVGGVLMAGMLALYFLLGYLLQQGGKLMGAASDLFTNVKAAYYSSAITLIMVLPVLTMLLSKKGIIDFTNFKIGYNMIYSLFVLYLYGILAIASRKIHRIDRWKAFVAALVPIAFLIVLGVVVAAAVLNKVQNFAA